MRKLAVSASFLQEEHCTKISETAQRCGFAADFYTDSPLPLERAADYEVIYAEPSRELLRAATSLRWFCSCFAGVESITDESLFHDGDVLLTNSAGAYGLTIAEHITMVALMLLRQMPTCMEDMRQRRWNKIPSMRSIYGSTITVLGTGDIGTQFARRAKAMGADAIYGVRRSHKSCDSTFDRIYTNEQLDDVLPQTEILVMALPSTPETVGILSRERIALLPKNAIVINVGRGTAVDQEALMEALNEERIAGAALDVMVPEPLPEDHPLWTTKNLLLTPHVSGQTSLPETVTRNVDMFCRDLENYTSGRPLAHLVDRRRGY